MTKHAEIAARLAAATPGPWVQGEMPEWEDYRIVSESVREEWRATAEEGDDWEPPHKVIITADECSDGDFDLILHAPTDIAFLLNEITRLEAELERRDFDINGALALHQQGVQTLRQQRDDWTRSARTSALERDQERRGRLAAEAEIATLREALERLDSEGEWCGTCPWTVIRVREGRNPDAATPTATEVSE